MNWADLSEIPDTDYKKKIIENKTVVDGICSKEIQNNKQPPLITTSYSNVVKQVNKVDDNKKTVCKKTDEISDIFNRNKKKTNYCYTCKPRGKVQKHIIERSEIKGVVFHFDLHKRPLILVTPIKHYETIYEMPSNEVYNIFEAIKAFCSDWKLDDYQVSFNNGKWQTHNHFHIKIKTSEKIINRLRRDHFKKISLEKNYIKTNY